MVLIPGTVLAQSLDPVFYVEMRPTATQHRGGVSHFHWYDRDGRMSVVGLRLNLQNGNQIHVSQRLEKVDNTGDTDSLDEYTLERRGEWKLGKQYLTFGAGGILRDSAPALTLQTRLVFDEVPATIALAESGAGRARGFVARVGRNLGLSVAVGEYFANQPTSLTVIRPPDAAPGRDRGYGLVWGLDARHQLGEVALTGEVASFRQGQTAEDKDQTVSDLKLVWRAPKSTRSAEVLVLVGWARTWENGRDFYRASAEVQVDRHFVVIPFMRFSDHTVEQIGVSGRIRF